jgi:hypothetical protein
MHKPRLFQYAVIKHPTEEEVKAGKKSEVLVPPSDWILCSEEEAQIRASRAIPDDELANAPRIEVAVRPF